MLWLVAIAMMLPHLQVQSLQVSRVLLGVEQGTADPLLPDSCPDHLQTKT